jgi:hypothetical protein
MFDLVKNEKYRRQDVWRLVKDNDEKMTLNFQQSGYERINEDLFAFINIGYKGHAGQIFPNKYDAETETIKWFGKKKTHSDQDLMKDVINGFLTVHCFGRWNSDPEWTYLGIGKVVNYADGQIVIDKDGTETFCLGFELNCRDSAVNPTFINNFDNSFEEGVPDVFEGKEKYVRHKTRERNPEIIKQKKKEFQRQNGRLFCEVCNFDFKETYGERGEGFIECHHNIPLHEDEKERITKTSDLSILCSNCHRMVHRKKKWLTILELRGILRPKEN